MPANSKQATLVHKDGKTQTIQAKNGFYTLELEPTNHNADPRDPSIYMIGGDPLIVDEQVMALPTDRLASRIEMVWPLDSAPVQDASKANIAAQLLMPGGNTSVACRYDPEKVELYAWRHYEERPREAAPSVVIPAPATTARPATAAPSPTPARVRGEAKREKDPVLLATGVKRFATEGGISYPVWDFNGVDVSYARTADQDRWLELFVVVNGDDQDGPGAVAVRRPEQQELAGAAPAAVRRLSVGASGRTQFRVRPDAHAPSPVVSSSVSTKTTSNGLSLTTSCSAPADRKYACPCTRSPVSSPVAVRMRNCAVVIGTTT